MTDTPDGPLVTIVIPTRNEAEDIARTLDAILAIEYERKEIIVVDDSDDETPQIVGRYADRGVRLAHREVNRNGCCGARNLGMQLARGEIVVLMNADNIPRPDFLRRLLPHYAQGADYVIVQSGVLNRENLFAQYIYGTGMVDLEQGHQPTWSEGFSARRSALEAVGYIPGDFPVPFCRDNLLGVRLREAGYCLHFDRTIPMEHVSPSTLSSYWRNQVWRGSFSAPYAYYFRGLPLPMIVLRECAKAARTVLLDLFVLPVVWRCARATRYTAGGWRALPGLYAVKLVQDAAIIAGNLKGVRNLWRALRQGPS